MEKDVKKNEIPACDDFSLMSGQIARNELQHSNTETTEILSAHKNIFTQNKILSKRKTGYHSPLAISNFQYYINLNKRKLFHLGSTVLVMIIFLTGLLSGIRQLHSFYTRFHNFDASDETLEAAISYIDNKDYSAAIPRLTYLLNSGWDGYTVYQELSSAYYSAGNDNASADTTCDFIINHYGTANCTNFTDAFRSLCEDTGGTTGNTAARVENILTECQKYAELYYQIEKELYSGQNKKALYDCELLKNSGADCFYFACLYSTALVETDHIDDAYHYIISFVQDDSTYQAKSVTTDQRKLLLNYIKGYVRSEKRVICENYINYALDDLNLDLHSGLQYSSPDTKLSTDDVAAALKDRLGTQYMYLNPLDSISVSDTPTLLYGHECYYAIVKHIGKDATCENYFFYDTVYGYIYMFLDGKYVNILENEGLEQMLTEYAPLTSSDILGTYKNSACDNICIKVTDFNKADTDTNGQISFSVIDTSTNEVLLDIQNADFTSTYACISTDDIDFTLIWGSEVVLLIRSDYTQNYTNLPGRYEKI